MRIVICLIEHQIIIIAFSTHEDSRASPKGRSRPVEEELSRPQKDQKVDFGVEKQAQRCGCGRQGRGQQKTERRPCASSTTQEKEEAVSGESDR